jgi:DNA helicase-2/ATP-dependent DNA helicase PcrA
MRISVEKGTFPFYRADDFEEERQAYHPIYTSILTQSVRRLLYVACTRAQTLLYLTHSSKRKIAGEFKTRELSEFISPICSQNPVRFVHGATT